MLLSNLIKILNFSLELFSSLARFFVPALKDRYHFEKEWSTFREGDEYEVIIHVSSEGELEQARPIIDLCIEKSLTTLLLYTSPSVKNKAKSLEVENHQLKTSCLPLLYKPERLSRVMCHSFFMVRYDFFPRLIRLARRERVHSTLLNATLKNKRAGIVRSFMWRYVHSSFNETIWASDEEKKRLDRFKISQDYFQSCDMRHKQIIKRQKNQSNLKKRDNVLQELQEVQKSYGRDKMIVFGSLWSHELTELASCLRELLNSGYFIFLAPHKIKGAEYKKVLQLLGKFELDFVTWNHGDEKLPQGRIVVCSMGGLLCEVYPFFTHAYVGGGFGQSVHSLLEPFWAQCQVYCGPRVHRSTEYDYIMNQVPTQIAILDSICDLSATILECTLNNNMNQGLREMKVLEVKKTDNLLEAFNARWHQ